MLGIVLELRGLPVCGLLGSFAAGSDRRGRELSCAEMGICIYMPSVRDEEGQR